MGMGQQLAASGPVAVLSAAWISACGCPQAPTADGDADAGACTYSTCADECRDRGLCYGSCAGGRCNCTDHGCPGDADGDADGTDATDAGRDDASDEDAVEDDGTTDTAIEERPGASPGVACFKVPKPDGRNMPFAAAAGSLIVHNGADTLDSGGTWKLRAYDRLAGAQRILDDLSDVESSGFKDAGQPSLNGDRVAYVRVYLSGPSPDFTAHHDLCLMDVTASTRRILRSVVGENGRVSIDTVVLEYPWVVWREVAAEDFYAWLAYALNVETGEMIDLVPGDSGVIGVGLLDGIALVDQGEITLVRLATGERRSVVNLMCVDFPGASCDGRWGGVITPDWIAWLDSRAYPECGWFAPCGTQVYGWNRRTETEQPLVTSDGMHGPTLVGHGDWLAYDDQRNDPDPWTDRDYRSDVYAFHLPSGTEIRVDDWPGLQIPSAVYTDGDEYRLLLFELTRYVEWTWDLWDCTLPAIDEAAGP